MGSIRWWEGILVELNDIDESKATVYFPGENDTQTVKVWNLRPSMHWEDGKWAPWMDSTIIEVPTFCRIPHDNDGLITPGFLVQFKFLDYTSVL